MHEVGFMSATCNAGVDLVAIECGMACIAQGRC